MIVITFRSALERVVLGRRQQFALRPDGVHDYGVTPADDYCRHDKHRGRHYAQVQSPLPRQQLDPTLRTTCSTRAQYIVGLAVFGGMTLFKYCW